jgi:hypothetical protein
LWIYGEMLGIEQPKARLPGWRAADFRWTIRVALDRRDGFTTSGDAS